MEEVPFEKVFSSLLKLLLLLPEQAATIGFSLQAQVVIVV